MKGSKWSDEVHAEMRAELDSVRTTQRKLQHAAGWHVTETAKPASRLTVTTATREWGCTHTDGSGRVSPNGKALRAWRKAAWSEEHLALAKQLGVSPKALQAEISRARKRSAD
jgi:hypothetical protein